MPFVAVTRLHIRSLRFLPVFLAYTFASVRQVRRAEGYRAGWTSIESPTVFWTVTCWENLDAMRAFRNGQPHLRAMKKLLHWCDEAAYVHWEQAACDLPDANAAYARLARDGHLSKVNNPSPRQLAGKTVGDRPPKPGGQIEPRRA